MSILILVWFGILGLTLGLFVILDGADLGIGALFPAARNDEERAIMVSAIGPMWYANETWLVIAGAVLFAAFPLAYSLLLSSLYLPAMALITGLVLRAVSTELRSHFPVRRAFWNAVFTAGSWIAILAQGFMLGGLLSGLKVAGGQFIGGAWDWLSPTSIIVAAGIAGGFLMLGSAHMVRRTEGEYQVRWRRILTITASVSMAAFVVVIVAVPILSPAISRIWLQPPRPYITSALFAGSLLGYVMILVPPRVLGLKALWALVVFILATCAVVSAIFPYFVPISVTIEESAAPRQTLVFMLVGACVMIPVIAVYNLYARGIFRGKVRGGGEEEY